MLGRKNNFELKIHYIIHSFDTYSFIYLFSVLSCIDSMMLFLTGLKILFTFWYQLFVYIYFPPHFSGDKRWFDPSIYTASDNIFVDVSSSQVSKVWKHFKRNKFQQKAKCNECDTILVNSGGSTTNLKNHLKHKHFIILWF